MKRFSLQCLGMLCLVLGTHSALLSQVAIVQTRLVPQKHLQTFLHRETTYWAEVARKAVKDGKLVRWELWERTDGFNVDTEPNYIFVNVFESWEAIENSRGIWDFKKVFPDLRREDIDTFSLSTVQDRLFYVSHGSAGIAQPEYVRVNFAYASNLNKYLDLETNVWLPFVQKNLDAGTTSLVSWGVSRLHMPRGTDVEHNVVTMDGFATLADALESTFDEDVEYPDFEPFRAVHEKKEIHIFRLVKVVGAEE